MPRIVRIVVVLGLLVAVAATGAGCGERDDLEENAAEVEYGDRRAQLEVASCGLDDDVLLLAATSADLFLQVLVTLTGDGDDREVDVDASAVSLEIARTGVIGAGDPGLLGVPAGAPGAIEEAAIRGDRVEIVAAARSLPSDVGPADAGGAVDDQRLEVVARCSQVEELAAGARLIGPQDG